MFEKLKKKKQIRTLNFRFSDNKFQRFKRYQTFQMKRNKENEMCHVNYLSLRNIKWEFPK